MARRAIISIVSHGHQSLIVDSSLLSGIRNLDVILRENEPQAARQIPEDQVAKFVQNLRTAGFGANHNRNFELSAQDDDDWFIICNPDIVGVNAALVTQLLDLAEQDGACIAAPALWNNETNRFDDNVRPFPTIVSLFLSFLGIIAPSRYSEEERSRLKNPEWASGAFLAVRVAVFRQLQGFDERYFMYMEDVDICRRARELGRLVYFYPEVQLVHNAARNSRNIFNRSFRYHLSSIIKYFLRKGPGQ